MPYRIFSITDCLNPNKRDIPARELGFITSNLDDLRGEYARLRHAGIPVEHIKILDPHEFVMDTWEFEAILHPVKQPQRDLSQ